MIILPWGPQELSIRRNEKLILLDNKSTWWKVRNTNYKIGLVPSNYLRQEKPSGESLVNRIANKFPGKKGKSVAGSLLGNSDSENRGDSSSSVFTSPGSMANQTNLNEEYISKFNYEASRDDELTLTEGMRVLVIEKGDDGWWCGKYPDQPNTQSGWFPSNYVDKASTQSAQHFAANKNTDCIMLVRTLYPFNSSNSEELEFNEREILEIIEEPLNDSNWWLARNGDGFTGLVPKTYVEPEKGGQAIPTNPNYSPVPPFVDFNKSTSLHTKNDSPQAASNNTNNDWYFGHLKRSEAERMLVDHARNGEFLVRDSETSAGNYSISMKVPGCTRHFKVVMQPDGRYKIGQRLFETMEALLEHYKHAPIYTSAQEGKAYLTVAMPR